MDSKSKREQQKAKSAYLRRNHVDDPNWEIVWSILSGRNFHLGGASFDSWRDRMVGQKLAPLIVEDYGWHYGTQPWWGELAAAGVRNLSSWIVACGLPIDQQFFGNLSAGEYMRDIIKWSNAGYTSSQVDAWRRAGLRPEDVAEPSKPVILIP